ncbi:hypothetical protein ACH3XW_34880 [Acanthocheilonema viteae]
MKNERKVPSITDFYSKKRLFCSYRNQCNYSVLRCWFSAPFSRFNPVHHSQDLEEQMEKMEIREGPR